MKVHKFSCENKHEFYLPLNLPQEINTLVDMLNDLSCPLCKSSKINISPKDKAVVCGN